MIKLSGTKASKRSLGEELCISQGQGDRPVAHSEEGLAGEQQQVRLENGSGVTCTSQTVFIHGTLISLRPHNPL